MKSLGLNAERRRLETHVRCVSLVVAAGLRPPTHFEAEMGGLIDGWWMRVVGGLIRFLDDETAQSLDGAALAYSVQCLE